MVSGAEFGKDINLDFLESKVASDFVNKWSLEQNLETGSILVFLEAC